MTSFSGRNVARRLLTRRASILSSLHVSLTARPKSFSAASSALAYKSRAYPSGPSPPRPRPSKPGSSKPWLSKSRPSEPRPPEPRPSKPNHTDREPPRPRPKLPRKFDPEYFKRPSNGRRSTDSPHFSPRKTSNRPPSRLMNRFRTRPSPSFTENGMESIKRHLRKYLESTPEQREDTLEKRRERWRESERSEHPPASTSKTGLAEEEWSTGWGEDTLTSPSKLSLRLPRGPMLDPSKMLQTPLASTSSTSDRDSPPHLVPRLLIEEGYIKDAPNAEKSATSCVLQDIQSPSEHKPIAQLAHGLDRVLFNPGVHWLQDPRSRVYNFTPWLESIPKVNDFDFNRITGFIKSSADTDLWTLAKKHSRKFTASTSSLTGLLSHMYFLISEDKDVDTRSLTQAFMSHPTTFTPAQRMPTSVELHYKEGVWAIDADKEVELAEKNVLTWMGTMLEKFLTEPEKKFKTYLRASPPLGPDTDTRREAYRYSMTEQFVMRSQLDAHDPRLPGTGVFDIKTRAAVPIRLDFLNYEENSGYLIKKLTGTLESFEKEYYDLIRSAFLKYSFQARIGNMDGVLVAYHNTARIFGFQYISLDEMEERLYGKPDGGRAFDKCVLLLEKVLTYVVALYGDRSIKCTFETREGSKELTIWVEPLEWDEAVEGRPSPIKQLGVTVMNFLDGTSVDGTKAIEGDRESQWVIRWTLTQLADEERAMRRGLEGAHMRQLHEFNFPTGVDTVEEMIKIWQGIDFGGEREGMEVDEATEAFVKTLSFRPATRPLLRLRELAVRGREETMREEREGREKVVWGVPEWWRWEGEGVEEGGSGGTLPSEVQDVGEVIEETVEVVSAEDVGETVEEAEVGDGGHPGEVAKAKGSSTTSVV